MAMNGSIDEEHHNEMEQKAQCLQLFTGIANRAYEAILKPADSLERLENEGEKAKTDKFEFDFENSFGQRILACTQHHYNCVSLYRKYFRIHDKCQAVSDEVTSAVQRLLDTLNKKQLSRLAVRKINELYDSFEDWREHLDQLHDTSLTVPPIKKRLSSTTSKNQVEAIYDITEDETYDILTILEPNKRLNELSASEGEKFVLLDSSNRMFWTVKNRHGETGELPSLFLTNCAPDPALIRKSSRLEDEFMIVVKKMLHLLESNPGPEPTMMKDLKAQYKRMLLSAARRSSETKPMPRSPIMSRAQSRESLLDKKDEKIIEYTTTITEVTIVEDTTCFAPEYSEFEGHEVRMFLIAGVIDTRDFNEISIEEARLLGIVDTDAGVYNNLETGDTIPISEAMSQGLILVEKSVTRKQKEKETKRRARSYEDLL